MTSPILPACFSALTYLLLPLALLTPSCSSPETAADIQTLTPVLTVDRIEPSLAFWTERLDFAQVMEVPGENGLVFAAFKNGETEVMLQTWGSLTEGLPMITQADHGSSFLYIEVTDLDAMVKGLDSADIVVPMNTTFYGMREVGLRSPGGHFVTLAQPVPEPEAK